ncbi:MAG TPA: UDP-N-acetylmuramate dehydrogenase [Candidatus Latescibacteria bacterium]|nr:UDP-N-acetylmuramate dehydrogenase [Candidatus Latescibacterota bacterium]
MTSPFKQGLDKVCKGRVRFNEPLSRHTSFGIGGPCDAFIYPADLEDLQKVLALCKEQEVPVFVIGNGTNLLVGDGGIRGAVLKLSQACFQIESSGELVSVGAGVGLARFLWWCARQGLGGMEFASGIPGSVGGAIRGNAGTLKGEISDRVMQVEGIDLESGESLCLNGDKVGFAYRKTDLPSSFIITKATFQLYRDSLENVKLRMDEYFLIRKRSQPLDERSAGCIFRNPEGSSAGQLIDEAGCKGMSRGGAVVSSLHANFIINRGGATASDVLMLIKDVKKRVRDRTGVNLELEIEVIGEF